jgi:hypothetical protein
MLKTLVLNRKTVPVPIPIKTLGEALRWIEAKLVPSGYSITRVVLDGRRVDEAMASEPADMNQVLIPSTRLEVSVESAADLSVQALAAVQNLATVVASGLKAIAVNCWQARPTDKPTDVDTVHKDIDMILDLIAHLESLLDPQAIELAPVQGVSVLLKRASVGLSMARSNSDWKAFARLLLNKLEPLLKDLIAETDSLQLRVLTLQTQASPVALR